MEEFEEKIVRRAEAKFNELLSGLAEHLRTEEL